MFILVYVREESAPRRDANYDFQTNKESFFMLNEDKIKSQESNKINYEIQLFKWLKDLEESYTKKGVDQVKEESTPNLYLNRYDSMEE